jgi:hypothetical protein
VKVYNGFTFKTGLAHSFRVSDRVYRGLLLKQGFLLLNITLSFFNNTLIQLYYYVILLLLLSFYALVLLLLLLLLLL